jgi:hypothetical protein
MDRHYHQAEPVADMMTRLSMPITECGCHAWLGKYGTHGYPYALYRVGKQQRVTRKAATVAYELAKGPVPDGLEVSHTCKQEWCVNPDHLIAETHSENLKRRRPFPRFKGNLCKNGHSLPPLAERNKNGACPICYRLNQAAYRARQKENRFGIAK